MAAPTVRPAALSGASALNVARDEPVIPAVIRAALDPSKSPKIPSAARTPGKVLPRAFSSVVSNAYQVFVNRVLYPISVGAVVGVADFVFKVAFASGLDKLGYTIVETIEEAATTEIEAIVNAILDSSWYENIVGPCIEELIFRVVIQGSVRWVAAKILPAYQVNILGFVKMPLADCVSIVATAILFGALHYPDGGIILAVAAGASGIAWGVLKSKVGLLSSCSAHMVSNTLWDVADDAFARFAG